MNPTILDAAQTKSRVLQMLEKSPFVSFATFGAGDWPDVRVLLVAAKDDVDSLWFATATESSKIAQLRNNPKAAIYGYDMDEMTEFRLFGKVELLSDSASRRKIWRDDFIQHFPDGVDSSTMIVMRFDTDHGVYDSYGRECGKF
ncbi:MAG: pyridoxamine 5'-phosphate oxidase family protein [Planctomycetaceae bacterium]|nr:pyridoxamine 5'-phosphate oxidase family protein [Planctomycetaceae bacterium]